MAFYLMTVLSHRDLHSDVAAPVQQFEVETVNELADLSLAMLARQDEHVLALTVAFTEFDSCYLAQAKCERVQLEGARLVAARVKAGSKDFEKVGRDLAEELNSRAWGVVSEGTKTASEYAAALAEAQAADAARPGDAQVLITLALAEYRAGHLEAAAQAIAKAVDLRDEHVADSDDLAVSAMIDARAGRADAARASLASIEELRAKQMAEAVAHGYTPTFYGMTSSLMAEARALLK